MEAYLERLQLRGRRATSPRRMVLEAMESLGEHFSAEELAARVPTVGRATVYRTLRLLQDEGLLCRVQLERGGLNYRLTQRGHHHHLTCTACGAIQDFGDFEISATLEEIAARSGFRMTGHWIEMYGRCAGCEARSGAAAARSAL